MIKEMQGWKVLRKNRYSCGNSINIHKCYYPIGSNVTPSIGISKLFFFKHVEDAISFSRNALWNDYIIVPCIAYNCQRILYISNTVDSIKSFWKFKDAKKSILNLSLPAPVGTWVADSIKCLE